MKKIAYLVALVSASAIIIISCTKVGGAAEDDPTAIDNSDNVPPVLTITRPTPNQVYTSGDSIIVEGNAKDEKKMYKGHVQLKDLNGGLVTDSYYETHFLSILNFRLAYKAIVSTSTEYTVYIEFQDHGLNTVSQTIKVKVNP